MSESKTEVKVLEEKFDKLSPWVTLVSRTILADPSAGVQTYHSLAQHDYVAVLAVTNDGRIPVVRQYRPAVKRVTLELPAGLLDEKLKPEEMIVKELYEEAGIELDAPPKFLGQFSPDTGRLANRMWCYFAGDARVTTASSWREESGVKREFLTKDELRRAIETGEFEHALHITVIFLALLGGYFKI